MHHSCGLPARSPQHRPSLLLCCARSKQGKDADAQVLRTCVLLDELVIKEQGEGAHGPVVVAQVGRRSSGVWSTRRLLSFGAPPALLWRHTRPVVAVT